jgi:hypothetical protein
MRDEMDGRLWDAHGRELSDGLHRLFTRIGEAAVRLARATFAEAAPGPRSSRQRPGQA